MTLLYISEYTGKITGPNGEPIQAGQEPSVTTQTVSFTTATASAAFSANTRLVRVSSDGECHLSFGAAPTATTSHLQMQADSPEYFVVTPGQKVSAVNAA